MVETHVKYKIIFCIKKQGEDLYLAKSKTYPQEGWQEPYTWTSEIASAEQYADSQTAGYAIGRYKMNSNSKIEYKEKRLQLEGCEKVEVLVVDTRDFSPLP